MVYLFVKVYFIDHLIWLRPFMGPPPVEDESEWEIPKHKMNSLGKEKTSSSRRKVEMQYWCFFIFHVISPNHVLSSYLDGSARCVCVCYFTSDIWGYVWIWNFQTESKMKESDKQSMVVIMMSTHKLLIFPMEGNMGVYLYWYILLDMKNEY